MISNFYILLIEKDSKRAGVLIKAIHDSMPINVEAIIQHEASIFEAIRYMTGAKGRVDDLHFVITHMDDEVAVPPVGHPHRAEELLAIMIAFVKDVPLLIFSNRKLKSLPDGKYPLIVLPNDCFKQFSVLLAGHVRRKFPSLLAPVAQA